MSDDPATRAAELRTEIAEAREDVGETAAALAAKTDVKARAQDRADELKLTARTKAGEVRQRPAPAIAAGVAVAVVAIWLIRRRSA